MDAHEGFLSGVLQIMVTRRNDARRRRVLSEEFVPTDENAVAVGKKPMQAYSYGANRRNQPKTTDIIPKRPVAFSLFFACVFTIIALLNCLSFNSSALVEVVGENARDAFALHGSGSLANWVCSVSLFLCSGLCIQLFLIRRYKRDDYGGMYHVWILMAIMFLLASVDCAIDLRTITAKLFAYVSHRSLLDPPWLMMTIESIILAIFVIRLLFEVRASRFSLATVLLVWIGFVGCIVFRHTELAGNVEWLDQKTAYGNCILLGCVGSLVALTVYARFVFLHAHGLIQVKVESAEPKMESSSYTRKAKTTRQKASQAESKTEEAPSGSPQPTLKIANKPAVTASPTPQPAETTAPPAKTLRVKPTRKKKAKTPAPAKTEATPAPAKQSAKQPAQTVQVTQKKAKVVSEASGQDELQQELENIDTVPMSKSERRRQRKLAKRAARQKKAA